MEQLVDALVLNSVTHCCNSAMACDRSVAQRGAGKEAIVRISSLPPAACRCSSAARYAAARSGCSHPRCAALPLRQRSLTVLNCDQGGFSRRNCISLRFTVVHNPAASAVLLSLVLIVKLWLGAARVLFLI